MMIIITKRTKDAVDDRRIAVIAVKKSFLLAFVFFYLVIIRSTCNVCNSYARTKRKDKKFLLKHN